MPKRHTLVWTGPALRNLLEIVQHIKIDKPKVAKRFGKQIKEKTSRLAQFPNSGRIASEFSIPTLREIIVGGYRIIYRIVAIQRQVEILTVFHGAMSIDVEHQPRVT
jgi:plasmid stabilization system protein ParE